MRALMTHFLVLLCAGLSLLAQEPLSLEQAVETGLRNSYQIEIAERNQEIAANNNDWGQAGRYPTVSLSLNNRNGYNAQRNPASFLEEFTSVRGAAIGGLDVTWLLFDGGRVKLTKEQLAKLEMQSEGELAIALENTIQNIMLAYYQAQIQQEQLNVLAEVLQLSGDRVAYQELRKEYGQASTFDLLQTQDAYLNDSSNFLLQLNNVAASMRNLNLAMGVDDISKTYELTDAITFEAPEYDPNALQEQLLSNNNQLANLFINRDLAQINTDLQRTALSPTVSLNTGATYEQSILYSGITNPRTGEAFGSVGANNFNYYLNFSATYNLFDGGNRKRAVENAQLQEINVQNSIDDLQRNLLTQLQNTLATYNSQKQVVAITESLVENARRNLEIGEERFRGGLINSFDYRTIQLSYINASQSQLNAYFNLKNTELELMRLVGALVN
jgi:outer membrane protein